MLSAQGAAADAVKIINPVSCANTAAATSSWIDVQKYNHGDLVLLQHIGAITGTLDGKWQDADDNSGTNSADLTGWTYTQVSSANNLQKLVKPAGSCRRWIRYVGTIVTGPALTAISLLSHPGSV